MKLQGYTKIAIAGVSWVGSLRGITRIIAFVKIALLARILGPEGLGLFAVASLSLEFLEVITETGINTILIQEEDRDNKYFRAAWVVSVLRGALVSLILALLSYPVSLFFNSPSSKDLLILISLVPLLRGFINPSIVLFQKNLQFAKEFLFRGSMYFIDALVSIYLALVTHSASSIVWGMLVSALIEVVFSIILIKPRPFIRFDLTVFKGLIKRGRWITFYGIFNYLFQEGDDWVVGRILGITPLGLYQAAYKVATLPMKEVGGTFGKVMFPIFTKIKEDKIKLKRAYTKVVLGSGVILIPFIFIVFLFTKDLVLILFGDKWLGTLESIKILALFGVIRGFSGLSTSLFLSLKKQEYVFYSVLAGIIGVFLTIFQFVKSLGILGASYSVLIGSIVEVSFIFYFLRKIFRE